MCVCGGGGLQNGRGGGASEVLKVGQKSLSHAEGGIHKVLTWF